MTLLFSLPFDLFYSHVIVISFAIHTLINVKKENWKKIFSLRTVIISSIFWVTLIGLFYSPNKNVANAEIGRQVIFLFFPVIFALSSFDFNKYKVKLLAGFVLCCTLTIIYLFADALRVINYYNYPLTDLFSHSFTNHNFSAPIDMHATFFSLQVGICLVYSIDKLMSIQTKSRKIVWLFYSLILTAGMLQLSSKSAIAAILIALVIVLPIFRLKGKMRYRFIFIAIFFFALSGYTLSRYQTFRDRFFSDLKTDLSKASSSEETDPRLARWQVAVQIIKQSPVLGHGSGSEIQLLKEAFYSHKLYNSFLNRLNAHNEYLSLLIKSGIIGLFFYLVTLIYGFRFAVKNKDVIFCTFMLLIAVVSMAENLLDVDKGTMFYGFFLTLFLFSNTRSNQLEHNLKTNAKQPKSFSERVDSNKTEIFVTS